MIFEGKEVDYVELSEDETSCRFVRTNETGALECTCWMPLGNAEE